MGKKDLRESVASVCLDTDQDVLNAVFHVIDWDQERFDTGSYWDPSLPSRFTIREDGIYRLHLSNWWNIQPLGSRGASFIVNTVNVVGGTYALLASSLGGTVVTGDIMLELDAGDFIEAQVLHSAGVTTSLAGNIFCNQNFYQIEKVL